MKRLTEVGDPLAKKRFKDEIAIRYGSGHPTVRTYLAHEGYLKFLNQEELECLIDDQNIPIFRGLANDLRRNFENYGGERLKAWIIRSVQRVVQNFGMHNLPYMISKILKEIPQNYRNQLVKIVYEKYCTNREFPKIRYLNTFIQYFEDKEFEYVKYNDKIIAIIDGTSLDLSSQNIVKISEIAGLDKFNSNIEDLDLNNNQIKEITGLEKFVNLKILKIANNQILRINGLDNLNKLQNLSLRNNNISEIMGLENLTNLKHLDLSGNKRIEEIPESLNNLPGSVA